MRLSRDAEMADFRPPKEDSWAQGSILSHDDRQQQHSSSSSSPSHRVRSWLDSFRRDPGRHVTPASVLNTAEDIHRASMARRSDDLSSIERARSREHRGDRYFDLHAANVNTANTLLSRELKSRHLQMIAIGGSIGT
jgi:amino acid transporter